MSIYKEILSFVLQLADVSSYSCRPFFYSSSLTLGYCFFSHLSGCFCLFPSAETQKPEGECTVLYCEHLQCNHRRSVAWASGYHGTLAVPRVKKSRDWLMARSDWDTVAMLPFLPHTWTRTHTLAQNCITEIDPLFTFLMVVFLFGQSHHMVKPFVLYRALQRIGNHKNW